MAPSSIVANVNSCDPPFCWYQSYACELLARKMRGSSQATPSYPVKKMRLKKQVGLLAFALVLCCLDPIRGNLLTTALAATAPDLAHLPPASNEPIDFNRQILPLFQSKCVKCHGPEKQRSGFRIDNREAALNTGDGHAPNIKPGHSADSPLIQFVAGLVPDMRMPAKTATIE